MPNRLTTVDLEILAVLRLECARSQGYLIDRTGRSRQQIHTRLQILTGQQIIHAIHHPTAMYEYRRSKPVTDVEPVELNLIDSDGDEVGKEWVEVGSSGRPHSHAYVWHEDD